MRNRTAGLQPTGRAASALVVACALAACHSHASESAGHDHGPRGHDHGHEHGAERPALSFTHWTDATELFLELPALVRGKASPCAAHVTKLEPFSALPEGSVAVILRGPAGADERFEVAKPSAPGIFRPVAKPTTAGVRRLVVEVRAPGLVVAHELGEVTVFDSALAARRGVQEPPEAAGRISFLKEQQWPIAFGTAAAALRALRPSLRTFGVIRARADGELVVTAPVAGRVASAGRAFPRLGERFAAGDRLAMLAPRLEAADAASLELAVTSATLELGHAEREKERLEGLRTEGAVPERRVQDAALAVDTARAAQAAAQRRLEQFRRVERTAGYGEGAVQLRAPLSGVVTELLAAPGAFVEAGAPILRITDPTQLWLEAAVPAADVPALGVLAGASLTLEGSRVAMALPAQALVARGHRLDPVSRTAPVIFSVDNASGAIAIGAFGTVELYAGEPRQALAVPSDAVVDDGSALVVYVQVEGESFERRVVRLGARDGGFVEVLGGLAAGERVVTRGAWSVKLAASAGSVPAHGHSH